MARTSTVQGKRVRAKLTSVQKSERRARRVSLATDVFGARQAYAQEAVEIANKHGRYAMFTLIYLSMRV
jgi:hypothetical protein